MNYRIKDGKNGNIVENTKNFQLKPDFIEKNILIPTITEQVKFISLLFNKMKNICTQLQNEGEKYAQDYTKNFESILTIYHQKNFKHSTNEEHIKSETQKLKNLLLNGVSDHLRQYMDKLSNLGEISNQEDNMEKIIEYMINTKKLMDNIVQFKNKIFNITLPMTTVDIIDKKTGKVIRSWISDIPEMQTTKIGLRPFETSIDEIASFCKNGILSIDSWFKHLQNKRIQYMENIVNQSKVQSAQEQTKAAKWTFYTQLGFMVLSVLFVIVSYSLSEYKKEWRDLFTTKQKITKTVIKNGDASK